MQRSRLPERRGRVALAALCAVLVVLLSAPQPAAAAVGAATCYRFDPATNGILSFSCASTPCRPPLASLCQVVVRAVENALGGGWIAVPPADIPCTASVTVSTGPPPSYDYDVTCHPVQPLPSCTTVSVDARMKGQGTVTATAECAGISPATCGPTTTQCSASNSGSGTLPFACRWTVVGTGQADVDCRYT